MATRDTTQKFKFVYQNMYSVYLKGKKAVADLPKDDPIASLENSLKDLQALKIKLNGMLRELQEMNKE